MPAAIHVHGARTHNLQDLTLAIPREAWTVVCGVSGSGKSSLVVDTLGAESRRRFLGTQRRGASLDLPQRPDVDRIEGLPPAVSAGFVLRAPSARETLGTTTEVTHALRSLFMRAAVPHCPTCGNPVEARTREGILAVLLAHPHGTRLVLTAPHGTGPDALEAAAREGFVRVRVGNEAVERIEDVDAESIGADDTLDVVVDRLIVKPEAADRFASSIDQALAIGGGRLTVLPARADGPAEATYADRPYCGTCRVTYPPLSTAVFSFNSPSGACSTCQGRGVVAALEDDDLLPGHLRLSRLPGHVGPSLPPKERKAFARRVAALIEECKEGRKTAVASLSATQRKKLLGRSGSLRGAVEKHGRVDRIATKAACPACDGTRLTPYARAATVAGESLPALESLPLDRLRTWMQELQLRETEAALTAPARGDLEERLTFLCDVGLGYLTAARDAVTLSTGELRRARLAAACAARMSGLLYLLDEPSAGLHPHDRGPLLGRLQALVKDGNTVVCVEHAGDMIFGADHLLELGPGPGAEGGRIVTHGPLKDVLDEAPATLALRNTDLTLRDEPRDASRWVELAGATRHNLQNVSCRFPAIGLTAVTGVSGAGKSTLALEVLAPAVRARLAGAKHVPGLERLAGIEAFDHLAVAGSSAPRHPRATAGSVLGALAPIRTLFAATLEARARGWSASWFSTNVDGGRCDACKGTGFRTVALRDLPEHRVPCDVCAGRCFRPEVERVRVKGLSIADVLALPIGEAAQVFQHIPRARRPLAAAADVGLGYIPLGEPTTRVSGGEALRLRLAAALGRGRKRRTLYVLDEPCAGLHPHDVGHLVEVLLRLAEDGNAVVAVEHNQELIRQADHVLELGPGPGEAGGRLVYEGPPAGLPDCADAVTLEQLRKA